MNRKNLMYLLILLVLGGVAFWMFTERSGDSTLKERKMDYNFTISDTASVDKIVLRDKSPSEVTLIRTDKGWTLDGEHPVRKDAIEVLLQTFHRMEMRNFIPEKMQSTVMGRMSSYGTEVEVYQNGEMTRNFFVGTDAPDEMATYMMIRGSDAPYAVHMPGFNGILSTRFFTEPHLWRNRRITNMDPRNIREVEMKYSDPAQTSFRLQVRSSDDITLTDLSTGKVVKNINLPSARQYLVSLSKMSFEGAIIPSDPIYAKRDSLLASEPVFELEVRDAQDRVVNLQGYKIKGPEEPINPDMDEAPEYDPDRMHGFINEEEMVLIQYYGLRRVLQSLDYFTQP